MGVYAGIEPTWAAQTNVGRTHVATKGIVQSGLVLNLDAGVSSSYSGSGTTWTDLSGSGNNGTLVNGVGYNSGNGGSLVFDGVDDYVSFLDANLIPTIGLTLSTWIKTSVADKWVIDKANGSYTNLSGYSLSFGSSGGVAFYVGNIGVNSPSSVVTGNWINITTTWIPSTSLLIYRDGNQISFNTTSIPSSIANPSYNLQIGTRGATRIDQWNGNIAQVSIYNRALTAAEIQQNYLATKGRFGL